MKSKEFVEWFKGFSEGVHEYNLTPKQWEKVKEKLSQVDDKKKSSYNLQYDTRFWTIDAA